MAVPGNTVLNEMPHVIVSGEPALEYTFTFKSRCACAGGCATPSVTVTPTQGDLAPISVHSCSVGFGATQRNLAPLTVTQFTLDQEFQGQRERVLTAPQGMDQCFFDGGAGFLQQFADGEDVGLRPECRADFNIFDGVTETSTGLVITVRQITQKYKKIAKIEVVCDISAPKYNPIPDMNKVQITEDPSGTLNYVLRFKTSCACPGVCVGISPVPAAPAPIPDPGQSYCKVGDRDLSLMRPLQFASKLSGSTGQSEYWFAVGFCQHVSTAPLTSGSPLPCTAERGAGYLHAFNIEPSPECFLDMTTFLGMDQLDTGVQIHLRGTTSDGKYAIGEIFVHCDITYRDHLARPQLEPLVVAPINETHVRYHFFFSSSCACRGGCPALETVQPRIVPPGYCAVGNINLEPLVPQEFVMEQHWVEHVLDKDYVWSVGWCRKLYTPPLGPDPCSAFPGFVQQSSLGVCHSSFSDPVSIEAAQTFTGVVLRSSQHTKDWQKEVTINLHCDHSIPDPTIAVRDMDRVVVFTQPDASSPNGATLKYLLEYRALCACPGACITPTPIPSPVPVPVPPQPPLAPQTCEVNGRDLGPIQSVQWQMDQNWKGTTESYTWNIGWCSKIYAPTGFDPCFFDGGAGYLQQFADGSDPDRTAECRSDFNVFGNLEEIPSFSSGYPGGGVRLFLKQQAPDNNKTARIEVTCDESAPYGLAVVDMQQVYISTLSQKELLYILKFRSRCACIGGCAGPTPPPPPLPPAPPTGILCQIGHRDFSMLRPLQFVATLPGQKDEYWFAVSWCEHLTKDVLTPNPCIEARGAGMLHAWNGTQCKLDMLSLLGISETTTGVQIDYREVLPTRTILSHVEIHCDAQRRDASVRPVDDPVRLVAQNATFAEYNFFFTSPCACKNGCQRPLPTPPSTPRPRNYCVVGDVNLEGLEPFEFTRKQHWVGHTLDEDYAWVVGWCSPIRNAPLGGDPCVNHGFVEQFTSGRCETNFTVGPEVLPGDGFVGATVRSLVTKDGITKVANVHVHCDPLMLPGQVQADMEYVLVVDAKSTLEYHMQFRSKCGCPNGCSTRSVTPTPTAARFDLPPDPGDRTCKVGTRDLSSLTVEHFKLDQIFEGKREQYTWLFGWCSKVLSSPEGFDQCYFEGGAGFMQQYQDKPTDADLIPECRADFNIFAGISEEQGYWEHPQGGVKITVKERTPRFNKTADIYIWCDQTGVQGYAAPNPSRKVVPITRIGSTELSYRLDFLSLCACPGKCSSGHAPTPPIPAPPQGIASCQVGTREAPPQPFQFATQADLDGNGRDPTREYWIATGWCNRIDKAPVTGADPCTASNGAGFMHFFSAAGCAASFNKLIGLRETDTGIALEMIGHTNEKVNHAIVYVHCEPTKTDQRTYEVPQPLKAFPVNSTYTHFEVYLFSRCACSGGCTHTAPVQPPAPPAMPGYCVAGNINLESVAPLQFEMSQHWVGNTVDDKYSWAVNWCNPPVHGSVAPCKGATGFVQQFSNGVCHTDFNSELSVVSAKDYTGILITSVSDTSTERKVANVHVMCDTTLFGNGAIVDMDHVIVASGAALSDGRAHLQYNLWFRSRCACPGACATPTPTPTPTVRGAQPPIPFGECTIEQRDLRPLRVVQMTLDQHFQGQTERYIWVFGWCSRIQTAPAGMKQCSFPGGPGFLHQYQDGNDADATPECRADFNQWGNLFELAGTPEHPDGGVQLTVKEETPQWDKVAEIRLWCDKSGAPGAVHVAMNSIDIQQVSSRGIRYFMQFRSKCACKGGCSDLPPPPPPSSKTCSYGTADLSQLQPFQFGSVETFPGQEAREHWFALGWCSSIASAPLTEDPCVSLNSYIHIFSKGQCEAIFDSFVSASVTDSGMLLQYTGDAVDGSKRKVQAKVSIHCDAQRTDQWAYTYPDSVNLVLLEPNIIHFDMFFRSRCACQGGCAPGNMPLPPVPPQAPRPKGYCIVDDINLEGLSTYAFSRPQHWVENTVDEDYIWVVGWCRRVTNSPVGNIPCNHVDGGLGFLQQFSSSRCQADFDSEFSMVKATEYVGVTIKASSVSATLRKTATIHVQCDWSMPPNSVEVDMDSVTVVTKREGGANTAKQLEYSLYFRSLCACPGGCSSRTPTPTATPVLRVHPPQQTCRVGTRDLSSLQVEQWNMHQNYRGVRTPYTWTIGWCTPILQSPAGYDPCYFAGGAGYMKQHSTGPAGKCEADFNEFNSIELLKSDSHPLGGVKLVLVQHSPALNRTAHISIWCDPSQPGRVAKVRSPEIPVFDVSGSVAYMMEFASKCACENGCEAGSPQPVPPVSQPPGPVKSCIVGSKDMTRLRTLQFSSTEVLPGTTTATEYWFVTGWCSPVAEAPLTGRDPCTAAGGAGYLHAFSGDKCVLDFTDFVSIEDSSSGVVIKLSGQHPSTYFDATVHVHCDASRTDHRAYQLTDSVKSTIIDFNHVHYDFYFVSRCACSGGCPMFPAPLPPSPPSPPGYCVLGNINLEPLQPLQLALPQYWPEGNVNEMYIWNFGWCSRIDHEPVIEDPCYKGSSSNGFLHQYSKGVCHTSFDTAMAISPATDFVGVVITVSSSYGLSRKVATINMECDDRLTTVKPEADMDRVLVVKVSNTPEVYNYILFFRSWCACPGACSTPTPTLTPTPRGNVPPVNANPCVVGKRDILNLGILQWTLPQLYKGQQENYVWVLGWCSRMYTPPNGFRPCSLGDGGFFQQFADSPDDADLISECRSNFNIFGGLTQTDDGVKLVLKEETAAWNKTAEIFVKCAPDDPAGTAFLESSLIEIVEVTTRPRYLLYKVNFRSRCACDNGCDASIAPNITHPIEKGCATGRRNLSGANSLLFYSKELVPSRGTDDTTFAVSFCKSFDKSLTPCPPGSYLSVSRPSGYCLAHLDIHDGIQETPTGVAVYLSSSWKNATAIVYVHCDAHRQTAEVFTYEDSVDVSTVRGITQYKLFLYSRCACAGGCNLAPTPPTSVPADKVMCTVGDIHLGTLAPLQFTRPQRWIGHNLPEEYIWLVGWCTQVNKGPLGNSPCPKDGGYGFVQQFSRGQCQADFDTFESIGLDPSSGGVVIRSTSTDANSTYRKVAVVHIRCDATLRSGEVVPDMNDVVVTDTVRQAGDKIDLTYQLAFRSRCACPGLCRDAPPRPPPVPEPANVCGVGNRDLSSLLTVHVNADIRMANSVARDFLWVVSHCEPAATPAGFDKCSSNPYVAQYAPDHTCWSQFTNHEGHQELGGTDEYPEGGVVTTVSHGGNGVTLTTLRMRTWCDETAAPHTIRALSTHVEGWRSSDARMVNYTMEFSSKCACRNGCTTPPPQVPQADHATCSVAGRNMTNLDALQFASWEKMPETSSTEEYWYVVGWCTPVASTPLTGSVNPCPKSYLHEFRDGKCRAYFDTLIGLSSSLSGMEITLSGRGYTNGVEKGLIGHVFVHCDASSNRTVAVPSGDSVIVTPINLTHLEYNFVFVSHCACVGGCVRGAPPLPPPPAGASWTWSFVIFILFIAATLLYVVGGAFLNYRNGRRGRFVFAHILCWFAVCRGADWMREQNEGLMDEMSEYDSKL
eukprot:TRINITY_DN3993_c0_g1_i2.p1 TRINITY_DN3993_c0_g1~~TRINITY_DN3993_c0_g1_i2.p1  ORF type:complete len:3677 (-),score=364.68 TRINITY_DN3993_c0_g1_i2:152-10774(-)